MCRADQKLTKYFSFLAKKPELRRVQSLSFLGPQLQPNLIFEQNIPDDGLALAPDFYIQRPEHSLLSYHLNGSVELYDAASDSDEDEDEHILTHDFEECFETQDERMNIDADIITYDLEECFAGLL